VAERDAMRDWTEPGHYGAAGFGVTFAEATIAAAWNVQGDPSRASFVDAVQRLFAIALPLEPNTLATTDALTAIWMGPRSWLLVAGSASPLVAYAAQRDALNEAGGALFDVSAGRVAWTITGPRVATVLAKHCPLDFHPRAFAANTCAQSLLGHVNALFIKHDDAPACTVMVARSFARDVWHSLEDSAAQYGVDIRPPIPYC
jgi:sarcosine oxidase, subunit gamma